MSLFVLGLGLLEAALLIAPHQQLMAGVPLQPTRTPLGAPAPATAQPCRPNEGWRWTAQVDSALARAIEAQLAVEGLPVKVHALVNGEVDTCDNFARQSVSLYLWLDENLGSRTPEQEIIARISVLVREYGPTDLTTARLILPDGSARSLLPEAEAVSVLADPAALRPLEQSMEVFPKKVYVVVYDPLLGNGQLLSDYLGWNEHTDITQQTIAFFMNASANRMQYSVVETTVLTDGWPVKIDGFRYTEEEYLAVYHGQTTPHSPDNVDYNAIVNDSRLDICGKANRGEIDEVWIYNGPWFGFWESTLVGPGAYWYNSSPVPEPHTCDRLIPIMGPSPHVGADNAVHNFGHRNESTMVQVYGGWDMNRTEPARTSWDKWALVDYQSTTYDYSGCGSVHYPPNGQADYDYANPGSAQTNCSDFVNYPELHDPYSVLETVTCTTWSCDQFGYLSYWFGHLPSNAGCGADRMSADWWSYFANPDTALDPTGDCPYPPEVSIAGRVVFGDGTPAEGINVNISGPMVSSTTSGRDGRYSFSNLSHGTYAVAASGSGYTSPPAQDVSIPPPAYDVDFVMKRQQLAIESVSFSPQTIYTGDLVKVAAVLENVGDETTQTQGPDPGFVYEEGDTFISRGFSEVYGMWRLGVNWGPSFPYGSYGFRWGTGSAVTPGERVTIEGYMRLITPQTQDYWVGLVREGMGWWDEGKGRTTITVLACPTNTPAALLSAVPLDGAILHLSWSSVQNAAFYNLYRGTDPYMSPEDAPYQVISETSYDDVGVLGDPETTHYYIVKPVYGGDCVGTPSQTVGEFEFLLVSGQ